MNLSRFRSPAVLTVLSVSILLAGCATSPATDDSMGDDAMMQDDAMQQDEKKMENDAMKKTDDAMMQKEDTQAMTCKTKNEACDANADCCGSMGLECKQVRTSDGGFAKRCLPAEVQLCKSDCTDGTWSKPRACRTAVAPKDMIRCESFVGDDCKSVTGGSRTTRECADT